MKKVVFISILLLSIACSNKNVTKNDKSTEKTETSINNQLYDIWLLKKINGNDSKSERQIILEINTKDYVFNGNAHCNNISGKLIVKDDLLVFQDIVGTLMACDELNLENLYVNLLEDVESYKIKSMHLMLFNEDGELILEYQKID